MITRIDHASAFRDEFHRCGRGDQFSYQALNMLYEYFEETDPEMELDVIAICCDFAEGSWQSIAADYSIEMDKNENEDEQAEQVRQYLEDEGVLVGEVSGGYVYRQH